MQIYFAGSIMGGRENLHVYGHIVEFLKAQGHGVPSEHVADPRVLENEAGVTPREVYERDIAWIRASDAMIAEVSTPSLGVGYEIATAVHLKKPTLCLHRVGLGISKMLTGNLSVRVIPYSDIPDLERHILEFFHSIRP